jgi:hypothetical protein
LPAGTWFTFLRPAARALLVTALLGPTAGHAQAVDAQDVLGPARIGATFEEVSRQAALACEATTERRVCALSSLAPIHFAGLAVTRVEAVFDESRLTRVKVSLDNRRYKDLLADLTARYGEGEDHSFVAIAGMSGDFVAGVHVWRKDTLILVFEQYAGKIDRCALTYGSEASMADLVRKTDSYPRGARRDL